MPINETLMTQLVKRYGKEKGEAVYWGMAGEGKGPFGPRGKYRAEHEALAAKAGSEPTNVKRQGRGKTKPRTAGGKAVRGSSYRRRRKR